MTSAEFASVVRQLSSEQEHFLKRHLLEHRLRHEVHDANGDGWDLLLSPAFPSSSEVATPALHFLFHRYVDTFPFVALNSDKEKREMWQAVHRFISTILSWRRQRANKSSPGVYDKTNYTNDTVVSALVLWLNTLVSTEKDLSYLEHNALKVQRSTKTPTIQLFTRHATVDELLDYPRLDYINDYHIDVVSVRRTPQQTKSLFGLRSGKTKYNHSYVLKVVHRTPIISGAASGKSGQSSQPHQQHYRYHHHFIARSYRDFRIILYQLASELPGIVSLDRFPLGDYSQADDGCTDYIPNGSVSEGESINGDSDEGNVKLYREKTRRALRHWLKALIQHPEVLSSPQFQVFIGEKAKVFNKLQPEDILDLTNRIAHDNHVIDTQVVFQRHYLEGVNYLQSAFGPWKEKFAQRPNRLVDLVSQITSVSDIHNTKDAMMIAIYKWSKAAMASGIYDTFMAHDASEEWLRRCRKAVSQVPYNLMYNVLKFTNPAKLISRMLDILFLPLPSLSTIPGINRVTGTIKKKSSTDENHQNKNLLMLVGGTLLGHELQETGRNLDKLKKQGLPDDYDIFLTRLENYFTLPVEVTTKIKQEAVEKDRHILLTVLGTDIIEPRIKSEYDQYRLGELKEQMEAYETGASTDPDDYGLWLIFRQYWDTFSRRQDNEFIQTVLRNPVYTKAIQRLASVYYKPFLSLMGKSSLHIGYRDLWSFIDEMFTALTKMNDGEKYYMDSDSIYNRIDAILEKYTPCAFDLMARARAHDDDKLILNMAKWMADIADDARIKFQSLDRVSLNLTAIDVEVDEDLFVKQLNAKIAINSDRRYAFRQYRKRKSMVQQMHEDQVSLNWERVYKNLFGPQEVLSQFGLDHEDIEDMSNLAFEQGLLQSEKELDEIDRELLRQLTAIAQDNDVGSSELDKMDSSVKRQLTDIFRRTLAKPQ
ncbi:hypothetical protein DIURU_001268 [Diutina rugosa]|uniref:PX domain-containing protein n=1 Tax=Diutina rugosa TaxID=5481 RepID=A0A642UVG1_DIURU|nr:uncharacterized protein DIURU_001268 [Diutina rugosa]KAA8906085.1 hypothetical protein DIURU_001268 [Diutina rugosa]